MDFEKTLSANKEQRSRAEQNLLMESKQPQFLVRVLDVVATNNKPEVRLAAAICFKNNIKEWTDLEEQEKSLVRSRILMGLCSSDLHCRSHLSCSFQHIVTLDFPHKWPSLLMDLEQVYSADLSVFLLCCQLIAASFEFQVDNNELRDNFLLKFFPICMDVVRMNSLDLIRIRYALKMFFRTFSIQFPLCLMDKITPWFQLILNILQWDLEIFKTVMGIKCLKWAMRCICRIFTRYGNFESKSFAKRYSNNDSLQQFAILFSREFAPVFVKAIILLMQNFKGLNICVQSKTLYFVLEIIQEAITLQHTQSLINSNYDFILSSLVHLPLCPTEETLELWDSDPKEYVNTQIWMLQDYVSVQSQCLEVIKELIFHQNYLKIIDFIQRNFKMQNLQEAKRLDGALLMLGCLLEYSNKTNKDLSSLVSFVVPIINQCNFRFLQPRALNIYSKFVYYTETTVETKIQLFQFTLCAFNDVLPLRVEAAGALSVLLQYKVINEYISPNVPQLLSALLKTQSESEVEKVAQCLTELVESFPDQVAPFAVELSRTLVSFFMRIVLESTNGLLLSQCYDEMISNEDESKLDSAMSIVETISSLISGLESSPPALFLEIEKEIKDVILYIFNAGAQDLFDAVYYIIQNLLLFSNHVSEFMWEVFGKLVVFVDIESVDLCPEHIPTLECFIFNGRDVFDESQNHQVVIFNLIQTLCNISNHESPRICGFQLIQSVCLNLKNIDNLVPHFIMLAVNHNSKSIEFLVLCLETIACLIYYNSLLTMEILKQNNLSFVFFAQWTNFIMQNHFKRTFSKKISILAITKLLKLNLEQIPHDLLSNWSQLPLVFLNLLESFHLVEEKVEVSTDYDDLENITDDAFDHDFESLIDDIDCVSEFKETFFKVQNTQNFQHLRISSELMQRIAVVLK